MRNLRNKKIIHLSPKGRVFSLSLPTSYHPSPLPGKISIFFTQPKLRENKCLLGGRDNILGYFYHRAHDWVFSKVTKTPLVKNGREKKTHIISEKHNNRVQNQWGNIYHNKYHGNMYPKVIIEKLWGMGSSSYLF